MELPDEKDKQSQSTATCADVQNEWSLAEGFIVCLNLCINTFNRATSLYLNWSGPSIHFNLIRRYESSADEPASLNVITTSTPVIRLPQYFTFTALICLHGVLLRCSWHFMCTILYLHNQQALLARFLGDHLLLKDSGPYGKLSTNVCVGISVAMVMLLMDFGPYR